MLISYALNSEGGSTVCLGWVSGGWAVCHRVAAEHAVCVCVCVRVFYERGVCNECCNYFAQMRIAFFCHAMISRAMVCCHRGAAEHVYVYVCARVL